jgi:hypothetical protein
VHQLHQAVRNPGAQTCAAVTPASIFAQAPQFHAGAAPSLSQTNGLSLLFDPKAFSAGFDFGVSALPSGLPPSPPPPPQPPPAAALAQQGEGKAPAKRDTRPTKANGDTKATPDAKRSQQAGSSHTDEQMGDTPPSPARDFARDERALLDDASNVLESRAHAGRGRGARSLPFDGGGGRKGA